jgi:hypothetical protein
MTNDVTRRSTAMPDNRRDRSASGRVTGRLRHALDAMIWENLTDNEAAVKFKISVQAIRLALKRPHVLAYLKQQRQVLHAREFARNSHALIEVRDQKANQMARVAAVRALEQSDAQAMPFIGKPAPGFVIVVNTQGAAPPTPPAPMVRIIEHTAEPAAAPIDNDGADDD